MVIDLLLPFYITHFTKPVKIFNGANPEFREEAVRYLDVTVKSLAISNNFYNIPCASSI